MKIFLHIDDEIPSKSWHDKFREILKNRYSKFKVIEFNLSHSNALEFLKSNFVSGDLFIGRIRHSLELLSAIKPIYNELCDLFEDRCFPCRQSFDFYDDKYKQFLLLNKKYPFPLSYFVTQTDQILLTYPFVCKLVYGASSENVWLAQSVVDVKLPCLIQEFCGKNEGDVRINVIGDKVTGYLRGNRVGDFRASGLGLINYPDDLPIECVELGYQISCENGFDSMAYDFLRGNDGHWQVLEFSYTYIDKYVLDAPYYYDMKDNCNKVNKQGIYPEEFILFDFFDKYLIKII